MVNWPDLDTFMVWRSVQMSKYADGLESSVFDKGMLDLVYLHGRYTSPYIYFISCWFGRVGHG